MMKAITKIKNSKALVTLVWVLGLLVVWEIFAFIIQATKRTPENIMPHVWQIFYSLIDTKPVSNGMSCLQVVLFNAGQTLSRAGQGFMIGTLIGFALAILIVIITNAMESIIRLINILITYVKRLVSSPVVSVPPTINLAPSHEMARIHPYMEAIIEGLLKAR